MYQHLVYILRFKRVDIHRRAVDGVFRRLQKVELERERREKQCEKELRSAKLENERLEKEVVKVRARVQEVEEQRRVLKG